MTKDDVQDLIKNALADAQDALATALRHTRALAKIDGEPPDAGDNLARRIRCVREDLDRVVDVAEGGDL